MRVNGETLHKRLCTICLPLLTAAFWSAVSHGVLAQTAGLIEGDVWHKADVARATFKRANNKAVDGTGVKVCVMSDSIDDAAGSRAKAENSNDVPRSIDIPQLQEGAGIGEGLAMLEIVHKIAPGAELGFATLNGTLAHQESNINALIGKGCKIIVDDTTDTLDAPFQDGRIAKLFNANADRVLFISGSGNFGGRTYTYNTSAAWEGDFVENGVTFPAFTNRRLVHQFSPGVTSLKLTAPTKAVWLYLSDPYDAATSVYTVWVYSDRTGSFLTDQIGSPGRPFQFIDAPLINDSRLSCVTGSTDAKDNCFQTGDIIMITKDDLAGTTTPSPARYLRLYVGAGALDLGTDGVTFGRNAAENVVSVGAALPGTGPYTENSQVEPRSSMGPRRIFYNQDNTEITPGNVLAAKQGGRILKKPDLAAANRVKTTLPPSTLNPFEGTSAAAPHVAGIAALIWSYRPTLTAARVREILIGSVERAGWDKAIGYGIPMADRALAIVDSLVTVDGGFNAKIENDSPWGGRVSAIALQPDGKIVVAGSFGSKSPVQRLNADGSPDTAFKGVPSANLPPSPRGSVEIFALAIQQDGKIVIGGNIGVARLNANDGTLDTSFKTPQTVWPGSVTNALAIQADKNILVGGSWGIARLKEDGSFDTGFTAPQVADVTSLALQPDHKILAGVLFLQQGSPSRNAVARLNENGSLDTSFNFTLSAPAITAIALQAGGKMTVAGSSFIALLNPNGSADTTFNATLNGRGVGGVSLQTQRDGNLLVAGDFWSVNGEQRRGQIVRLKNDGSVDRSFELAPAGVREDDSLSVNAMVLQGGGVLFGGTFETINGQAHHNIVRVKSP
jgi:uncharacterized delta-60 repeat protein